MEEWTDWKRETEVQNKKIDEWTKKRKRRKENEVQKKQGRTIKERWNNENEQIIKEEKYRRRKIKKIN